MGSRRRSSRRRWSRRCSRISTAASPKNHFTVGINDDVSQTSLDYDPRFVTEAADVVGCIFYGLGADGTVGANKNSIKIIGEETPGYAQGFFVYDSKKSGSRTTSHLRFGPQPIRSAYLVQRAQFIACHQFQFVDRVEMLARGDRRSGVPAQQSLRARTLSGTSCHARCRRRSSPSTSGSLRIDADRVATEAGMPGRINTIMQTCFFAISGVLPRDEAIARIKDSIQATYARKGTDLVEQQLRRRRSRAREPARGAAAGVGDEHARAVLRSCPRARRTSSGRSPR